MLVGMLVVKKLFFNDTAPTEIYTVITLFYSSESKPDANTEKQESNPLTNRPRADAMDGTYSTEHKTPNDSASATYATPNTPPEAEPTPG